MSIAPTLALAISPLALLQSVTLVDGPEADAAGLAADYGSGVCRISVFGKDADGEQIRAEFSRRLRDGNLSVSLYGPFIRHFRDADPNANFPVTVAFDTGSSAPSRSGGYDVGGFRESAWGGWGPGAARARGRFGGLGSGSTNGRRRRRLWRTGLCDARRGRIRRRAHLQV